MTDVLGARAARLHCRHHLARFGATLTRFSAGSHPLIIRKPLALFGATETDVGADGAHAGVPFRTTHQKVGARLTNISAIRQQPQMRCFGIGSAQLPAV
jgi:hypothetical protein